MLRPHFLVPIDGGRSWTRVAIRSLIFVGILAGAMVGTALASEWLHMPVQVLDSTRYPVDGATLWLVHVDGHGNYIDITDAKPIWQISDVDGFGRHGRGYFGIFGPEGDYGVVAQYDPDGDGPEFFEVKSPIWDGSGDLVVQFDDLVIPR